jgi:tRNA threonylcarbamoyladenosine modification (KEOPS) complex  Pcc1 subunit
MPELDYIPVYVSEVTETDLGDAGRNIKCANEFLPSEAGEVAPALDGLYKFPAPAVGEKVLVLQSDATNLERYYIPIRSDFSLLTDANDKVQIESAGDVEIEGANITIGVDATEHAVLGDALNQWLTDLVNAIVAITVVGNLGAPSSPPVNASQISALAAQLTTILSQTVTIKG